MRPDFLHTTFLIARKHRDANFVNILALGLPSAGVSRFREACRRRRRDGSTRRTLNKSVAPTRRGVALAKMETHEGGSPSARKATAQL
jgi:hypothetical protein